LKTLYIGDIHGDFDSMEILTRFIQERSPDVGRVVVVGDFGFFPDSHEASWYPQSRLNIPVYFIDGNHEDHDMLDHEKFLPPTKKSQCYDAFHISRGYTETGILYCGGARTTDQEHLLAGVDYFEGEELTENQVHRAIEFMDRDPVRVLVSHDLPQTGFRVLFRRDSPDRTRSLLDRLYDFTKPRLVISGHHHFRAKATLHGITFVVLRNVDHFHFDILEEHNLPKVASQCCLIADETGQIFEIASEAPGTQT